MTEAKANYDAWIAGRKTGIGGSDVAAILGLSKWRTKLDIYLDKIGESPEQLDNSAMQFGRILEPVLLDHYFNLTGFKRTSFPSIIRHPLHDWMIGSLDGLTQCGRVVEIKTARTADGWGQEGTDEIPNYYTTQVQHYLAVSGREVADVAVLIGGSDFRIYTVEADLALQDAIIELEQEFWQRVIDRRPPDPVSAADVMKIYPKSLESSIEATPSMLSKIASLAALNEQIKNAEKQADKLKTELQIIIGENSGITMDGKPLCTWKTHDASRFDQTAFKESHPELFEEFKKLSSTRVFRLSK